MLGKERIAMKTEGEERDGRAGRERERRGKKQSYLRLESTLGREAAPRPIKIPAYGAGALRITRLNLIPSVQCAEVLLH